MLVANRASLGARNGKKQTAEQLAKSEEVVTVGMTPLSLDSSHLDHTS